MPVYVYMTKSQPTERRERVLVEYIVREVVVSTKDLIIKAGLHHLSTSDEGQQMDALISLRMGDAHDHVCVNSSSRLQETDKLNNSQCRVKLEVKHSRIQVTSL